jgi:hypothetical protein
MSAYDPDVIRKHADKLYFEAGRAPIFFAFAGAIIALTVGLGLGIGVESSTTGITMGVILGVLAGGAGFAAGRSVAARMRLAAHTAWAQLEIIDQLEKLQKRD